MFLKSFKEKSNQKFTETIILNRKLKTEDGKMKSVGVLFNHEEFFDSEAFNSFLNDLNIETSKRQFLTYIKNKNEDLNTWDNAFTSKDFGWRGKLKNATLQNFTETKFDVLICYFLAEDHNLKQIAAMSKAELKVGISNADERFYDLIINVGIKDFKVFKTELKKYLTILNKL